MENNDNDILEVYNFQGIVGEQVPKTVQILIVKEGVEELPQQLCSPWQFYEEFRLIDHGGKFPLYNRLLEVSLPNGLKRIAEQAFYGCENLFQIDIVKTIEHICEEAFFGCSSLEMVVFEQPSHLTTIGNFAFCECDSLKRFEPPSSVDSFGDFAIGACHALVKANLAKTRITELIDETFVGCRSLQTVGLPKTLYTIGESAFADCSELVTVTVPSDSRGIDIGPDSFDGCRRLANLHLAEDSFAINEDENNPFFGCDILHHRFGTKDPREIIERLKGRFENYPIHKICYHYPGPTPLALRRAIEQVLNEQSDREMEDPFEDDFDMNPFHILALSPEPHAELFQVLLESLPNEMLSWKDANGKRPLDYLIKSWTLETKSLLLMALEHWMIYPLARWGATPWAEEMKAKLGGLLCEQNEDRRLTLLKEMYDTFDDYEFIESMTILELALWKANINKLQPALDRQECRQSVGAKMAVVIPHVVGMLAIAPE